MKNALLLVGLIIIAWIWLPTSPVDFFVIPYIINTIGFTGYAIMSVLLVGLLYKNIEGKGISGKFSSVKKEMKKIF